MKIHIVGSSGSGKTTLGKKLVKLFPNFKIVETDNFVTKRDRLNRDKLKTNKEKVDFIFDIYKTKFDNYNNKYKNIVYVGLLDSSVPNGKIFKNVKFDKKFF